MKNEFSIWSAYDIDLSPEDMVLALEDRGMTVSELSDEHGAMLLEREGEPEAIGAAFRAFAAAHGVRFPQGHLWLQVRLCHEPDETVAVLERWIRLFGAIGAMKAVLHCDGVSFPAGTDAETILDENAKVLKRLAPLAERCGVTLCLENLSAPFDTAERLLSLIEKVGSPALGITLDTGHLHLFHPGTQEEFILAAGKKLQALHLADNQGQTDQHMMPFGRGSVDFASVMRGLKAVGYTGLFNYEIPGERDCPMVLRKAKAEYLDAVTGYLFSL